MEQERLADLERAAEPANAALRARLADMAPDERFEALREFGAECGRHNERTHNVHEHIRMLNASQPERTDGESVSETIDDVSSSAEGATGETNEA